MCVAKGLLTFREMGSNVRTLCVSQRLEQDQKIYRKILEETYSGIVSDKSINRLMTLSLNHPRFTEDQKKIIIKRSVHVFANKEPMEAHNDLCLFRDSSDQNPVVKSIDTGNKSSKTVTHLVTSGLSKTVLLTRGCKVCLNGRNLWPEWGLFNNSLGMVIDIIYEDGKTPNNKKLPKYVLVDFPSYTGPVFLPLHATYVPIIAIVNHCEYGCCK